MAMKIVAQANITDKEKKAQYDRPRGVCPHCKKHFEDISWMAGDEIAALVGI